jgi:hypothetical protein
MSDFVEQCRKEWRRLGVPDPVADEMAADLGSDLSDAEAEGISAEELLGNSVFDPRSFAATWAAERGIIPEPPTPRRTRRRPFALGAFTAVAALTLMVAALLLLTGNPKVSLVRTEVRPKLAPPPAGFVVPPGTSRQVLGGNTSAPVEWILLFLSLAALGFAVWLWTNWSRSRPPAAPA